MQLVLFLFEGESKQSIDTNLCRRSQSDKKGKKHKWE